MDLLVIRHGLAESRRVFAATGQDDALRPLTKEGRRRMRRTVRGMRAVVPELDTIATSPFVRAVQTADIVAASYDAVVPVELETLRPTGSREDVLSWLQERGEHETVAIVGHEPHLGLLTSWLLAAPLNHFVELKKGGACLLTWKEHPTAGNAWLQWALPPGQLRKLGRADK